MGFAWGQALALDFKRLEAEALAFRHVAGVLESPDLEPDVVLELFRRQLLRSYCSVGLGVGHIYIYLYICTDIHNICMYIYVHIYMHMCCYMCIYVHILR